VISAAAATGARAHIVHLSAAECVAMISGAKGGGLRLTAETCPHYLYFAAEQVPDGATEFKSCPPIRDSVNREALWRGLEAGAIDCVVSDHSPCPPELKSFGSGDFGAAWGGIASLQLGLSAVWTVARRRGRTWTTSPGGWRRARPRWRACRPRGGWRPGATRTWWPSTRRDVRRGPRHAAAQAPGHPVCRADADRTREADVAARYAAA
jgi:allantoinase